MNCHDCQLWIAEALDAQPSELVRAGAEHHLAGCKACGDFARALRALEPHLQLQASRPRLSEDFESTVMRRLPAAPKRLRADELIQRRAQFESEHREALGALRYRWWPWRLAAALPSPAVIVAIGVAAWLVGPASELLLAYLSSAGWGLDHANAPMLIAAGLALSALIWNWQHRRSGRRWLRRFQMMLRSLHA